MAFIGFCGFRCVFLDSWARVRGSVAGCGGRVVPLIFHCFEKSKPGGFNLARNPGVMSWLVDLAGLDRLADRLTGMDWKI